MIKCLCDENYVKNVMKVLEMDVFIVSVPQTTPKVSTCSALEEE